MRPALILFAWAASSACVVVPVQPAGLPEYGRPREIVMNPDDVRFQGLMRYRELTRADFQARSPQPAMAKHAGKMGAYTCVVFPPSIDGEIEVRHDADLGLYVARAASVDYFAVMDPNCSWWNEEQSSLPRDYVLEHEQIHFALCEVEARKVIEKGLAMEARASTRSEAELLLRGQLEAATRDARRSLLALSTRFDEQTSATYAPQTQARWRAEVESDLSRLPAARDSAGEASNPDLEGLEPL